MVHQKSLFRQHAETFVVRVQYTQVNRRQQQRHHVLVLLDLFYVLNDFQYKCRGDTRNRPLGFYEGVA